MSKVFLVLVLCLLSITLRAQIISDYSCVFAGDYFFSWKAFEQIPKTTTTWPYLSLIARSNALQGYTFVAVSPQLNNFTNGLVFVTFYDAKLDPNKDGTPVTWFYDPGQASPDNPTLGLTWINQTAIPPAQRLIWKTTWKTLSISRPTLLYNEFTVGILLNQTLVPAFFNRVRNNDSDWYVYMGVNYGARPTDPKNPLRFPPLVNEKIMRIVDWTRYNECFIPGIYRWSLLTIPTFTIEIFFYFILTPLCLFLAWKWQPMQSRGFTPALASFSQFLVLLAQLPYLAASVEFVARNDCLFQIFFYYAATQISLILLPIHLIRYIFIINLNKSKDIFYTKMQVTKEGEQKRVEVARWPFRFVKILTNQWLNASIVILWYLFSCSVQLIVYFASGMSCNRAAYPLATLQTIVVVFFIIIWTLGLIYDFIVAIIDVTRLCKRENAIAKENGGGEKPNGCRICTIFFWEQFTKKDPFYYRFELYFIGPVIIIFYIVISLSVLAAKADTQRVVSIFFSSTLFVMLLFYQVLFPLGLTLLEVFRKCFNPSMKKLNEEIDLVLMDPKGHQVFVEFAKSEWSTENISCWDDIQRYKREKDSHRRLILAEEIFLAYFNGQKSKLECNVNQKVCEEIKTKLHEAKNDELFINKELEDDLFDNAQGQVKINLCDTFSRLRLTQTYKGYYQNFRFTRDALGMK